MYIYIIRKKIIQLHVNPVLEFRLMLLRFYTAYYRLL